MVFLHRKFMSYGVAGIYNEGNTCFINSILQSLLNTKSLLQYILKREILKEPKEVTCRDKNCLVKSLYNLFTKVWDEERQVFCVVASPVRAALNAFSDRFANNSQHDAQEFLQVLLEALHRDINRACPSADNHIEDKLSPDAEDAWQMHLNKENSKVVDIFGGLLRSILKCKTCSSESISYEPFYDLSLPIPEGTKFPLDQCLELFTKEETLEGNEMPTCSNCNSKQPSTKKISIQKLPEVLVIHLKKFSGTALKRRKEEGQVKLLTENINMCRYSTAAGDQTYKLYASVCHHGSIDFGHYTVYCRNPVTGLWNNFSDTVVSLASLQQVLHDKNKYILFFNKLHQESHNIEVTVGRRENS